MQKSLCWLVVGIVIACQASSASAGVIVYNGDTTGGPLWNRPNAAAPPSVLSGASAVPYHVQQFHVDLGGAYDFLSTTPSWDNFTFLYQTSFDPGAQLTNVIIGIDDFGFSFTDSGFNGIALNTGVNYFFVTTGFDNTKFGTFQNSITGPGNIFLGPVTAVPEPSTFVILGMASLAIVIGRRRFCRDPQSSIVA